MDGYRVNPPAPRGCDRRYLPQVVAMTVLERFLSVSRRYLLGELRCDERKRQQDERALVRQVASHVVRRFGREATRQPERRK